MALMQLFNLFDLFSTPRKAVVAAAGNTEPACHAIKTDSWPLVDRRQGEDRRTQERRTIHCQPYIDTRKNNGRRRSLGRRVTDQTKALPF